MSAAATFFAALDALVEGGGALPCWDRTQGNPWLGDTTAEREYAAHRCRSCPLTSLCVALAVEQQATFGIFGGLNFAQRPGKRRTQPLPPATQGAAT